MADWLESHISSRQTWCGIARSQHQHCSQYQGPGHSQATADALSTTPTSSLSVGGIIARYTRADRRYGSTTREDSTRILAWTHLYNLIEPYVLLIGTATGGRFRSGRHAGFAPSSFSIRCQVDTRPISSQRLLSLVVGPFWVRRQVRRWSRAPRRCSRVLMHL